MKAPLAQPPKTDILPLDKLSTQTRILALARQLADNSIAGQPYTDELLELRRARLLELNGPQ
jgi:hypothetical protein